MSAHAAIFLLQHLGYFILFYMYGRLKRQQLKASRTKLLYSDTLTLSQRRETRIQRNCLE